MKDKEAIIDIGSNTIRLVIYEKQHGGRQFHAIENIKRSARLRNHLNEQQLLNEEGLHLLIETLESYQMMLNLYEVTETTCVATATIRQAKNKESIIQAVEKKTGLTIRILSEYEEAYFGYLAVVHSMDITEGITVDMGGGSTELTYFRDRKLVDYISLPFGSLSLKSQFVKGDIPLIEELMQIRHYVNSQFEKVPWIYNKQVPIVAMGGSARNVARIHQGFVLYPLAGIHQYEMSIPDIRDVKERVERLSYADLQNLDGLSKDRTDTILAAVNVFEILCDISKATQFILSRKGLREGVLFRKRKMIEDEFTPMVNSNIYELIQDYHLDIYKSKQLKKIAAMIFEQVKKVKGIGNSLSSQDLELLNRGAYLFHFGKYIKEESSSSTFYLLANRTIIGLSHYERVKLALVASYEGKSAFRQYIEPFKSWYSKEERKKICLLGVILKLAQSLSAHKRNVVQDIKITPYHDFWVMNIQCQDSYAPEQYYLEKQKKHFEKLLKIKLVPKFGMKSG